MKVSRDKKWVPSTYGKSKIVCVKNLDRGWRSSISWWYPKIFIFEDQNSDATLSDKCTELGRTFYSFILCVHEDISKGVWMPRKNHSALHGLLAAESSAFSTWHPPRCSNTASIVVNSALKLRVFGWSDDTRVVVSARQMRCNALNFFSLAMIPIDSSWSCESLAL